MVYTMQWKWCMEVRITGVSSQNMTSCMYMYFEKHYYRFQLVIAGAQTQVPDYCILTDNGQNQFHKNKFKWTWMTCDGLTKVGGILKKEWHGVVMAGNDSGKEKQNSEGQHCTCTAGCHTNVPATLSAFCQHCLKQDMAWSGSRLSSSTKQNSGSLGSLRYLLDNWRLWHTRESL